jgi:hypothetical protein
VTLILSYASKNILIQISDRLVTRGSAPFDALANKCVIYSAADGILALAYTGLAYVADNPTDDWIANILGQQTPGRVRVSRSLFELKRALEHVATGAPPVWKRQWLQESFEIPILGWQWNARGRARPLVAWLSKPPGTESFEFDSFPRWWFVDGKYRAIACPEGNYPLAQLRGLTDRLSVHSVDEAEAILVDAIREVSTRIPQVGPHCMSIVIHPPSTGRVRVRYLPTSQAAADISTASGVRRVAVAFSPWILAPGMTMPPSVISGSGWEAHPAGPYTFALEAPDDPHLAGLMSTHPRRPPPDRH